MRHVCLIAPRFLENTNRYLEAFTKLPGVMVSVISGDHEQQMPPELRPHVAGVYQTSGLDTEQLTLGARAITRTLGKIDRLVGFLEELQVPLAEVREAVDIEGLRPDVARNFRDKDRMKEVLRSKNVPVARSTLATTMSELEAFIDAVGLPVIVKPRAGLGTRATYRVTDRSELAAIPTPSRHAPLQVEEFVRAREHTCETVTIRGKPVWRSGTRYFPSPLEVIETPWIQYAVLLPREADDPTWTKFHATNGDALTALFGDAANSSAGTALTHMEWFLREDGTALVNEVGVRPPGVQIMPLMSIAHDTNLWADWARLMALDEFTPKPRVSAAGSCFFRGPPSGSRVAAVTGIEQAVEACGGDLVMMRTPKVGQPRASGYEGEGYAIVKHATTEGVKRALKTLIETVQVRYA